MATNYAIIETGGKQYRVHAGALISVEKIAGGTLEELDASAAHAAKVLNQYLDEITAGAAPGAET